MNKTNVVHIVESFGGGVYTYLKNLTAFLDTNNKNDINTFIIYSGNRKEISDLSISKDFSDRVMLIEISMQKEISPIKDFVSVTKIIRKLKEIKPKIIHLHSSKAGVLGRLSCIFIKKTEKTYYSPHGYSFLRRDISNFKIFLYKSIEIFFTKAFKSTTIACGDTEYIIASKISKSILIRNSVDIYRLSTFNLKNRNEKLVVGIVGRITEARNPDLFNNLALRFPDLSFRWIGDGELRHILTSPNIKITGWIDKHDEVLKKLNHLDIYLQTSLWEGLPIAVLEAMALKKPVIATNIIGNKDAVVHNETGFLFNEIKEVEEYISLLKNKLIREEIGEKGFIRCEKYFDNQKNFKQLVSLYLESSLRNK